MSGPLQYHRLEDDEPLRVPPSVTHRMQFFIQGTDKVSPYLPTWHVVATEWHDREVPSPTLSLPFF